MSRDETNGSRRRSFFSPLTEIVRGELQRTITAPALHCLGGLALVVLGFQVATGFLLMAYYHPTMEGAHQSVAVLSDNVRLGWLVRALHARGSDCLILLAVLYVISVFAARGYQHPRQLAWASGLLLLLAFAAFGVTGTLLPWDQFGYWMMETARRAVESVPVVGGPLVLLALGSDLGTEALLRFHAIHVVALPAVTLWLLAVHLLVIRLVGIADPRPERSPVPLFPDFLLWLLIAILLAVGALLSAAVIFPPSLLEPAAPLAPPADLTPQWYLLPARAVLRSVPGGPGVLILLAILLLLLLLPVIDPGPVRTRRGVLTRWALGLLVCAATLLLGLRGCAS